MTTASKSTPTHVRERTTGGARLVADGVQRWLAIAAVALCAIQFALAGFGFWVTAVSGGNQAAGRAAFEPHAIDGQVLQWIAIALLIGGVIAHANKKAWIIPLVLAILLWVVQGLLVGLGFGVSAVFGALHAFDGTVITAGFVWLAYDRWQHRLAGP